MLLLQDNISTQIQDLIANTAFKISTKDNSVVTTWYACNACNVLARSCGLKIASLPLENVKKKSRQTSPSTHLVSKEWDWLKKKKRKKPYVLFT